MSIDTVDDAVVELDGHDSALMAALISELPSPGVADFDGPLLELAGERAAALPERLRASLRLLRGGTSEPALLVRGLPIDPHLPATPLDGRPSPYKESRVSELCLLLCMSGLAAPIGYREEKEGLLVHDICPKPGSEHKQENTGSVYFELHSENAFHPYRPDFVGLLCLRRDHDRRARTLFGSARTAAQRLPERTLAELRRPHYATRVPSSFVVEGVEAGSESTCPPKPVLTGPDDHPRLCVDAFNTVPLTPEAKTAFDELVVALRESLVGRALEPGDLLVVDNHRAVHARTSFAPRYDGCDRWLQRMFAVADIAASAALRPGRSHVCAGIVF